MSVFFLNIGTPVQKIKRKWSFLTKIACIGGIFRHSPHSPEVGALTHNHELIIESMNVQAEAFGGPQLFQNGSDPVQVEHNSAWSSMSKCVTDRTLLHNIQGQDIVFQTKIKSLWLGMKLTVN